MTIKQQGGIFGRNPTFNNVTIDGALSGVSNLPLSGNLVLANGQGIDFSATSGTGTSELFDDYEEGTFTATLTGTTSAPTTPVTVTSHYTKIGRSVTVTVNFLNVSTVGASGNIRITGLPFTSALNAYTGPAVLGSAIPNNYPASLIGSGNTYLDLVSISTGGGVAMVSTTGVYIFTTTTYFV